MASIARLQRSSRIFDAAQGQNTPGVELAFFIHRKASAIIARRLSFAPSDHSVTHSSIRSLAICGSGPKRQGFLHADSDLLAAIKTAEGHVPLAPPRVLPYFSATKVKPGIALVESTLLEVTEVGTFNFRRSDLLPGRKSPWQGHSQIPGLIGTRRPLRSFM